MSAGKKREIGPVSVRVYIFYVLGAETGVGSVFCHVQPR